MSRFVRKQMLSIVEQLKDAAVQIGAGGGSPELLEDCQEAAIALGMRLEQIRGEGVRTVAQLEAYCEEIYQVVEELDGNAPAHGLVKERKSVLAAIRNRLLHRLDDVEACLKEDMPDRLEVVFLPYNASMWDSLESVWLAARDDPDCEDYVVPIPYYDKTKDNTLGEFHYEGGKFPENVPVTHYHAYDMELRHPDVVYIHNPYDDCNIITSIDPLYYAERIQYFTEKLVYIPYFVLAEPDPGDASTVENIRKYVLQPGVFYANTVILQSENMRKVYIEVYTDWMKEHGLPVVTEELEQKFLGTGSPKFDRVARAAVDYEELPDSWRHILEKPDGSRKKVVFYNTSLSAMLHEGPRMISKIARVLEVFRSYREEVALLWRPHPLMQVNLQVMCPELWDSYCRIVESYQKDGWGIYDDTADLDRAIALADAYYGDGSSVVQLCRSAGLPVMIQNAEI